VKKIALSLLIIFFLKLELFSHTNVPEEFTAEKIFLFTSYLIEAGEYERAKTELFRLKSFYPDFMSPEKYFVTYLYINYKSGHYGEILSFNIQDNLPYSKIFFIDSYCKTGDFSKAAEVVYSTDYGKDKFWAEIFKKRKVYVDLLMKFDRDDTTPVYTYTDFEELSHFSINITKEKKSPALGALLGIIPGMGYAYAGQGGTGVVAFTVVGLGGALTVGAHKNSLDALAILSGIATLFFYGGSIYGGYAETIRYNNSLRDRLIFNLEKELSLERDIDNIYLNFGIKSNVR